MAEQWASLVLPDDAPAVGGAEGGAAYELDELLVPELPTWEAGAGGQGALRCLETAHTGDCTRCGDASCTRSRPLTN